MKHSRSAFTYVAGTLRVPSASRAQTPRRTCYSVTAHGVCLQQGFTLFELILAITLSATLLALIGTAINLYLTQVDASRMRVEEAQLARSILAMIADDIRAAAIYQPQDTSSIAELMSSGTAFDVDSIDDPRTGSSGGSDSSGSTPSGGNTGNSGSSSTSGGTSGTSGTSSTGSSSSLGGGSTEEEEGIMPLGVNGSISELYVDVTRLPRREELFSTVTGYTNAPLAAPEGSLRIGTMTAMPAGITPPSDLKTVRYFVRQGEQLEAGSAAATSLSPDSQRAAGLVRQEIPRSLRVFAEQTGNSTALDSGQSLVAPEVIHVEFRYYGGSQVVEVWDMGEQKSLPFAVEVRIWLITPDENDGGVTYFDQAQRISKARQYRQTVYLPMSELSAAAASRMSSTGDSSSSSTSGSSFDSSPSSEGSGSESTLQ